MVHGKYSALILGLLLAIICLATMPHFSDTSEATGDTTGACGDNLMWTFNPSNGKLSIIGDGPMTNYNYNSEKWGGNTIKTVSLPSGLTSIGNYAFYGCDSLESITIPGNVETIGDSAFYSCDSLQSITIPSSVVVIKYSAFGDCTSLADVELNGSIGYIWPYAFNSCTSLESVSIPDSVVYLGDYAFQNCTSLREVTIGDSLQTIPEGAFGNCGSLIKVTIGDSVTDVGDYAFGNTGIMSLTLGKSVSSIGNIAFPSSIFEIINKSALKLSKDSWDYGGIAYASEFIYSENGEPTVTVTEDGFIYGGPSSDICLLGYTGTDTVLKLPYTLEDGYYRIYKHAFIRMNEITTVIIPESVTAIGESAFRYCTSIKSIVIPDHVVTIDRYAFGECTSLTTITLGTMVESIGDNAFYDCKSLSTVINNSSLEITKGSTDYGKIGYYATTIGGTNPDSSSDNGFLYVIIIAAVALVCAVGAFIFLRRH